jgi:hypothetical protein
MRTEVPSAVDVSVSEPSLSARLLLLEEAVARIEARNQQVAGDKAWETSFARKALVAVLTFAFTALVFLSIGAEAPLRNAFIPMTGYVVSTLSLRWMKHRWLRNSR